MKQYEVEFWEKQSVWAREVVRFESEVPPTKDNIQDIINKNPTVDYIQNDYAWETAETEERDFDTDFEIREC